MFLGREPYLEMLNHMNYKERIPQLKETRLLQGDRMRSLFLPVINDCRRWFTSVEKALVLMIAGGNDDKSPV
jgi:hypothetical protein